MKYPLLAAALLVLVFATAAILTRCAHGGPVYTWQCYNGTCWQALPYDYKIMPPDLQRLLVLLRMAADQRIFDYVVAELTKPNGV